MFLGLGVLGSLTKTEADIATTTASRRATTGAVAQTPVREPYRSSRRQPLPAALSNRWPSAAATPKPAPTPIVEMAPVDVPTSHKFSGKKQTYTWTEVALGFDKALYKVTGTAGKTKSCTVKWSMSDGDGRDGFTLKISAGKTKAESRAVQVGRDRWRDQGHVHLQVVVGEASASTSRKRQACTATPGLYDFKAGKTDHEPTQRVLLVL